MNSFWNGLLGALGTLAFRPESHLTTHVTRPHSVPWGPVSLGPAPSGSANYWRPWPGRRSYRAAQREARARRNRNLHHGRRS